MRIRNTVLVLATLLLAAGTCRPAAAADANALIKSWEAAWARVQDFYCDVDSTVKKGDAFEARTYKVWFKRPLNIRSEVVKGNRSNDAGSVAVYKGDGQVTGHQGGMFSGVILTISMNDPRATSIRGGVITDLLFNHHLELIHQYQRRKSTIEVGNPTTIAGRPCIPLTLYTTNQNFIALNDNIQKDVIYYDQQLGLPVQWERYEPDGKQVVKLTYANLRVNGGVNDALFNAKATSK